MKQDAHPDSSERRTFLRQAAMGGAAAAALASLPAPLQANAPEAAPAEANKGYRLTAHIIDYYKSVAQ
jgi:FtsP/CotA-like multicopper oxidase with cupredoxin domain